MFDMRGRLGDWKFARIPLTPKLFAPLGGNPGVPDVAGGCTGSSGIGVGDRVRVRSTGLTGRVVLVHFAGDGSVSVALDGRKSFLEIDHFLPDDLEPETAPVQLKAGAPLDPKKEIPTPYGVELPLGWALEVLNDPFNSGDVIAEYKYQGQFVVRRKDASRLSVGGVWARDSYMIFSSLDFAVAALKHRLELDRAIGADLIVDGVRIPDGWVYETPAEKKIYYKKVIEKQRAGSGMHRFVLRLSLKTGHSLYLSERGWCNQYGKYDSLSDAVEFIKKYDCELPNE